MMTTKIFNYRIPLMIVLALIVLNLSAQKHQAKGDMKQKMSEQRETFLINKLGLTDDEAKKFIPVYNEYKAEIQKNRNSQMFDFSKEMSDKDAEIQLNNMLNMREKEIEIQRSYINKFKAVIPTSKIAMVLKSEREFKEKVIKNIKKRRQQSGNQTQPAQSK